MKIAIPLAEGKLTTHFGHCKSFALVSVLAGEAPAIQGVEEVLAPPHQPGLLPVWLQEQGVTQVIAGGMGGKARELFEAAGIAVQVGAPREEPQKLVEQFLAGTLEVGVNGCDH